MEQFLYMMNLIYLHMCTPFTVWGFTFSLWQVYTSTLILSLIVWFVMQMFSD